jgi:hypothetical protein
MPQDKERRSKEPSQPIVRPRNDDHGCGGNAQQSKVKGPPRAGSPAKSVHDTPVDQVCPRHVDLQKVAVGRESMIHQKAEVMQLSRIIHLLPVCCANREEPNAQKKIQGKGHPET